MDDHCLFGSLPFDKPLSERFKSVYLAGPVDDISPSQAATWRAEAARQLPEVLCVTPQSAFLNQRPETGAALRHVCEALIGASSVVLAYLAGPGLGFGTCREVEIAVRMGKRVVLVVDTGQNPLFAFDCVVVNSLADGCEEVWKLLR